jgi:hypothetical protein
MTSYSRTLSIYDINKCLMAIHTRYALFECSLKHSLTQDIYKFSRPIILTVMTIYHQTLIFIKTEQ